MKKSLAVVINFCTNEYPFLRPCVEAALTVADQVFVSVADHFFDGVPENRELLQTAYLENSTCTFLEYAFDPVRNFYGSHPPAFWHNWGRLIGFSHLDASIDYVLFLDVDEIIDAPAFSAWFEKEKHPRAQWLNSFWYFREATFRARRWEENAVLIERKACTSANLMHHLERAGTFFEVEGEKKRHVTGLNGLPMVHHYSWVRSKEQMLHKVKTWGHRDDYPWQELVESEFKRSFSGKDFIYGGVCDTVPASIILKDPPSPLSGHPKNVRILSTDDMHRLERVNY